jgi:hypothetical protein
MASPLTWIRKLLEPARAVAGENRVSKLKIETEEQNELNLECHQD